MTEPLTLRFHLTADLAIRAMTAWQEPFDTMRTRRFPLRFMVPMMVAGLLVGLAASAGLFDLVGISAVNGALFGFILGMVFWFAMHWRQNRLLTGFAATRIARAGGTTAQFDAEGLSLDTDDGRIRLNWRAIDEVIAMRDATALRGGEVIYPIPDTALPPYLTPDAFRARLRGWQRGAR